MKTTVIALILAVVALEGCTTSSHVLTGLARPALPYDAVRLYTAPPSSYEVVGLVNANGDGSGQMMTDMVMKLLKIEAGKMGANGVVLGGLNNPQADVMGVATVSTPAATTFVPFAATYNQTSAQGTAIWVTDGVSATNQQATAPLPR